MFKLKNVLVPIDFSVNSIQAYEFALYIASQDKTTVHLMHVIDSVYYSTFPNDKFNEKVVRQARIDNAKEELKKFIFEIPRKNIDIIEVLAEGIPDEQIVKYALNNSIDTIVISSHGWTGLTHLATGSITQKVMQNSEIPVICVKANIYSFRKNKNLRQNLVENWVG